MARMSNGAESSAPNGWLRTVAWLEKTLGVAAGAILFVMMVVTVIDVVGRYFFAAPLPAAYELIQFGMAALVFFILPVVMARGEEVTVELIPIKRSPRLISIFAASAAAISVIALVGFGIELWSRAESFRDSAQISPNLRLPLAPFAYAMSVIWFACAIIVAVLGFLRLRGTQPLPATPT